MTRPHSSLPLDLFLEAKLTPPTHPPPPPGSMQLWPEVRAYSDPPARRGPEISVRSVAVFASCLYVHAYTLQHSTTSTFS